VRVRVAGMKDQLVTMWRAYDLHGDLADGVLCNAPESWGGEESAEHIALNYVATLEARLDAAGISREKYPQSGVDS
jgi:hypothetical protein